MRGFLGRNGRIYSDSQRKAIFADRFSGDSHSIRRPRIVDSRNTIHDKKRNRFVLPFIPVAAGIGASLAGAATPAAAAAGSGLGMSIGAGTGIAGSSLAGAAAGVAGATVVNYGEQTMTSGGGNAPVAQSGFLDRMANIAAQNYAARIGSSAADSSMRIAGDYAKDWNRKEGILTSTPVKALEVLAGPVAVGAGGLIQAVHAIGDIEDVAKGAEVRAEALAMPAIDTAGVVAGSVAASFADDLLSDSSLNMPSNSGWLTIPEESNAFWSNDSDKDYMDVNTIRELVKKQYPGADVDTKVKFLDPGKYTQFALRENPGREREAVTSNGFYSPMKDTAFLEKDTNKLNTLRAAIHELVHDMSDDGVNDSGSQKKYMLNEGYADYVAKKIMIQEIGIPEKVVDKTIGYPEDVRNIERLVALNGRKKVDEAFLVKHSLDGLKLDGKLQACDVACSNVVTSGL